MSVALEIIRHYLEELTDIEPSDLPDCLARALGITKDTANEIILAITKEEPLSDNARRFLSSHKPCADYEVIIDDIVYQIKSGVAIKVDHQPLVIVSYGNKDMRTYRFSDLGEWQWFADTDSTPKLSSFDGMRLYQPNRIIVWDMTKHKLGASALTFQSSMYHVTITDDGSSLYGPYGFGDQIVIPLLDGLCDETLIGKVKVKEIKKSWFPSWFCMGE